MIEVNYRLEGSWIRSGMFFKSESLYFGFNMFSSSALYLQVWDIWSTIPFFFSWVCFCFSTALGNPACHQLLSSLWCVQSYLFRTIKTCQLPSTADCNLGDTDIHLRAAMVVNKKAWSSVLFSRATCVAYDKSRFQTPNVSSSHVIAQHSSHQSTFNDTWGETHG